MATNPVRGTMADYLNDPKAEKKFKKFLREEKRRASLPSQEEKDEIKKLEHQALRLWVQVVKKNAGGKCEVPDCKKVKFLNSHHVESFVANKTLRYDPENGICLCPAHHKFGWLSAHRSFCFVYNLLATVRPKSLQYLLEHYWIKFPMTKAYLEETVMELAFILAGAKRERTR